MAISGGPSARHQAARESRFRINGPDVLHETVEEETIIVNLDSGTYYDLNHTGAFILALIEGGASVEEMVAGVQSRYRIDPAAAAAGVQALVGQLDSERLIVAAHGNGAAASARGADLDSASVGPAAARGYEEPRLGKYTDMQELLLLDPVHEVDETGWPRRA